MTEYANNDFWTRYGEYLVEVESKHRAAISALCHLTKGFRPDMAVLDLGCGQFSEAKKIIPHSKYFGVDAQGPARVDTVVFDYRKDNEKLSLIMKTFQPELVVSLFSSEITAPVSENYEFYKSVLDTYPNVEGLIVSGFYYISKAHHTTVAETGDLVSHQSIDLLGVKASLNEARVYLPVPSTLFGTDVVEVWKIITR